MARCGSYISKVRDAIVNITRTFAFLGPQRFLPRSFILVCGRRQRASVSCTYNGGIGI